MLKYLKMNQSYPERTMEDIDAFYKKPVHLTSDQLQEIVTICFNDCYAAAVSEKGTIALYFRKDFDTEFGVDFWLSTEVEGEVNNFTGTLIGEDELMVYCRCSGKEDQISNDWGTHFSVPVRRIYEYLVSIDYFGVKETRPTVNPIFLEELGEWQEVFSGKF